MRRLVYVLAGLLVGLASQAAVLWGAVLLGRSSALDGFRNRGPGSVGDLILLLALVLTLDAVLAGLLMLILRRHRRRLAMVLLTLGLSALIAVVVVLGFALV